MEGAAHTAARVGEAANPGPPTRRHRRPSDGLTICSCNVNGLKHGKTKWDKVRGQAAAAKACLIILTETHMTAEIARNFDRTTRSSGFASNISSHGTINSRGVAILGPADLKRDPWEWPADLQGRVASGIMHAEGADVLIVGVYLSCESQDAREQQMRYIAERVAAADMPAIVAGDFNATLYSEENQVMETHELCPRARRLRVHLQPHKLHRLLHDQACR